MYIAAWLTIGFSFAQQDVLQRIMSTRNERDARRSSVYAGFMYIGIALLPLTIGICGNYLYPDLLSTGEENSHEGLILRIVKEHSGLPLQILFFGALTSAIMSTASGAILSPATVITENLVRPLFPKLNDKTMLAILRASVLVVTAMAAFSAMSGKSIYELNADASTILLVTFTVPILLGIYWKRTSLWAAWAAMLGGFSAWAVAVYFSGDHTYPTELALFAGLGASLFWGVLGTLFFPNTNAIMPMPTHFGDDLPNDHDAATASDANRLNS